MISGMKSGHVIGIKRKASRKASQSPYGIVGSTTRVRCNVRYDGCSWVVEFRLTMSSRSASVASRTTTFNFGFPATLSFSTA